VAEKIGLLRGVSEIRDIILPSVWRRVDRPPLVDAAILLIILLEISRYRSSA
jgi:hypothetical protein